MSTRSTIAIFENGTINGVYCHFDGYFSGVGATLNEHYTNEEKVRELISQGGISTLEASIGQEHSFNDRPEGQTTFYHRDRGELLRVHTWVSAEKMQEDMYDCEFFYLFLDGVWCGAKGNDKFQPLTSLLNEV